MSFDHEAKSTGTLLSDALQHLTDLVRGEVALAKAEVEQNLRNAGVGIGLIVSAVVLALVALNVLAGALVAALAELGLSPGLAALAVGGTLALIALALILKGASALKPENLAPERTMKNIKRDAKALKEIVTDDPSH